MWGERAVVLVLLLMLFALWWWQPKGSDECEQEKRDADRGGDHE